MAYADITFNDPNPIKRWIHRRRFSDALRVFGRLARGAGALQVLDFGAGDGELVLQIARRPDTRIWAYEPVPVQFEQAQPKLAGLSAVTLVSRLDGLEPESFDFVFCLEVFEHLPQRETDDALNRIRGLLKPGGCAVLGVPHEVFLPALFKGLFRIYRRHGEFDATFRGVLAASIGRPPSDRPTEAISPGFNYHYHHFGFDHRVFAKRLRAQFDIAATLYSPIPLFGAMLNSEVYFVVRKH